MQRLLVIEHEPDEQQRIAQILEGEGYSVLTADTGYEGLHLLREECVDLVLVDLLLPQMDGLELTRQLRRIRPHTKIIAIAGGNGDGHYLSVVFFLGAHMMIQKPFTRQILVEAVRMQLSS